MVAERLQAPTRPGDTVARLGGDEFVIIAEDLHHTQDAETIAENVATALDRPVTLAGHVVRTPASIGIATSGATPGDLTMCDADYLLRAADAAMYVAKRQGGRLFHRHDAIPKPPTANVG